MPFLTLLGAAAVSPAVKTAASVLPSVVFALYRHYRERH